MVTAHRYLALAVTAVFALSGCGAFDSNDIGPRSIDEDRARSALSDLRVAVPEGATFVAGIESPPGFVGSAYFLRFDVPAASTPAAVAELNTDSGFGDVHRIACASPLLTNDSLQKIGLRCAEGREVPVLRTDSSPAEDAVSPGDEAIAIVDGGSATQLYVIAEGT